MTFKAGDRIQVEYVTRGKATYHRGEVTFVTVNGVVGYVNEADGVNYISHPNSGQIKHLDPRMEILAVLADCIRELDSDY